MAQAPQDPGAFLARMLEKYRLSPLKFSQDICLSQSAIRLIIVGKAKITVPVAMRLAKYFNTNPEFWLAMQMKWDIAEASKDKSLMKIVRGVSRVSKSAASGAEKKPAAAPKTAAKKKKSIAKKSAARKKTTVRKSGAKKKVSAAKKPVARKKTATTRKRVAKRRVVTAKKPVSRKKTVAARKKAAAKTRKKPSVRRGRPAVKRKR